MMICAPVIVFDYNVFITAFPAFANPVLYPQATIQMYWTMATSYVDDCNYGWLQCLDRQLAINLMCAHLLALSVIIARGQYPQVIQGSTIDKISVTLTPPPLVNQWDWWLNSSPYGMQLHSLLQANSVGGWYVGGSAPLAGFGYPGYGFALEGGGYWGW